MKTMSKKSINQNTKSDPNLSQSVPQHNLWCNQAGKSEKDKDKETPKSP
jgi:hypothetical protein